MRCAILAFAALAAALPAHAADADDSQKSQRIVLQAVAILENFDYTDIPRVVVVDPADEPALRFARDGRFLDLNQITGYRRSDGKGGLDPHIYLVSSSEPFKAAVRGSAFGLQIVASAIVHEWEHGRHGADTPSEAAALDAQIKFIERIRRDPWYKGELGEHDRMEMERYLLTLRRWLEGERK